MALTSITEPIKQEISLNPSFTDNQSVAESCCFTSKLSLKSVIPSSSKLTLFNSRDLSCRL